MQVIGSRKLTEQELSIRIFSDGFSFSTPNSQKRVVTRGGESLRDALEQAFQKNGLLQPDYDEVNVYSEFPSTRIPLDEFRSEEAQALYRLTFGDDSLPGMRMHYEMLPALEIIEVFVLDAGIEDLILSHYPQATVHSFFGQLMNRMYVYEKRHRDELHRLYAYHNGQHLFLFSYEKGRLAFANSFEASDLNTQVYYLLYAWKQLGMRQRRDVCVLLDGDEDLRNELQKYIVHISCV